MEKLKILFALYAYILTIVATLSAALWLVAPSAARIGAASMMTVSALVGAFLIVHHGRERGE